MPRPRRPGVGKLWFRIGDRPRRGESPDGGVRRGVSQENAERSGSVKRLVPNLVTALNMLVAPAIFLRPEAPASQSRSRI